MKLTEILTGIDVRGRTGTADPDIKGIAYDSRAVKEGFLFVAIRGFVTDGHKYIDQALENGAAAVMGEDEAARGGVYIQTPDSRLALAQAAVNFYQNPARAMKIIGVTGTNGKTTVTNLIRQILELKGHKCGLIGTNKIMVGGHSAEAGRTTPESLDLQALLRKMADEKVEYVIMEVSSHSLALSRVWGLQFEVGVFTNITQDHLDFHKNMSDYATAKARLFAVSQNCVVNMDDGYKDVILNACAGRVRGYAIETKADVTAENLRLSARGVIFDAVTKGGRREMRLGIPGRFSVYNALAAICAGQCCGIPDEDIVKGLVIAKGVKGRMEVVHTNTPYTVLIDYAHTPDAIENVVNTARQFAKGRVITLFGCGGDRDKTKRPKMGEIACRLSDYAVITSDNPRTEDPEAIIEEITRGARGYEKKYSVITNRRQAIEFALGFAREDDIVILAGKGHETYQILKDETREFDERKIVKEILEGTAL